MKERVFRYKLDFYYQQAIIYLATLVLYAGIRGNFIEDQFNLVFKDPILYIISFFVILSLIVLLVNVLRDRKIVITDNAFILRTRTRQQEFLIDDIEWIHIGKERFVQTAGHFQLVVIKFKQKPFALRLRVGRYERSRELIAEMERIAQRVPMKKRISLQKFRERKSR
ncbi:MAG: hypothetical protein N3A63_02720 [Bacteroidetes bacterium]|nr:hypothetical protein [Bacteroidota bacterium]